MAIDQKDKDFVSELLQQLMPMMVMAATAGNKPKEEVKFDRTSCPDCKQMRGGCKGKHEKAVAYPSGDEFEEYFQGITLNGITYNSGHQRIPVLVPEHSGIANQVALWEQQERNQRYGIKKSNVTRRLASTV